MKNKIKEYKGVILFYLIIIMCIFLISNNNINLNGHDKSLTVKSSIVQK